VPEDRLDDETVEEPMGAEALGDIATLVEAASDPEDDDEEPSAGVDLDEIGRARVPDWVGDAEPEDLTGALESICFALNRPLTIGEAAAILGRSGSVTAAAAEALAAQLRGRGLMLQRHHEEIQLVTRPQVSWAVHRALNPERPGRLSRPALETLAIVAYRQPVTRAVIEAIRGVNCDAVLESLERRGLLAEVGRQDTPGQPRLFGTTLRFLQLVGLERIEDLPPLPEGMTVPDLDATAWSEALDGEAEEIDTAEPAEPAGEPGSPQQTEEGDPVP
jgi:segregation and condensation protein B